MFKKMESLLLFLEDDDEEIFLLLGSQLLTKDRIYHPLDKLTRQFNFLEFSDEFCNVNFRFYKQDLLRLLDLLRFPAFIKLDNRVVVSSLEALCLVLRRLSYPNRLSDLMWIFPRTPCELSRIFNQTVQLIKIRCIHLITDPSNKLFSPAHLRMYANAIREKGSPYKDCIGFLYGTVRAICRPTVHQKDYYNGHKRVHALKFQSLMLPNGIIGHLHGPEVGRRHDSFLLEASNLINKLEHFLRTPESSYHMYGDPAYPLLPNLMVPFRGVHLTELQQVLNKSMSSDRECVEWGFGKIISIFAFLDYKKNLKLGFQNVQDYYFVGALLTNCHTCLYGSETSTFYSCDPPSIEDYLL